MLLAVGLLGVADAADAQPFTVFGLTSSANGQQLVRFSSNSPGAVTTLGFTGATLLGLDFRPATGALYGYDGNRLYLVNPTTGAATFVFDVGDVAGSNAGFDFNPTVDRIRVTGPTGTNLRLNPNDGVTITDTPLAFAVGDVNAGVAPTVTGVAYTNNTASATTTTLYGIDVGRDVLVTINPPNAGTVNTVGSLGFDVGTATGFDVVTVGTSNFAFLAAQTTGALTSGFYTVNLSTGAATLVGAIGTGSVVQGIAIAAVPEPGTWALLATGLVGIAGVARRRRRDG